MIGHLKKIFITGLFMISCCLSLFSQYYFKGIVKDETGKLLSNVKIILRSSGYVYYSGSSGGFGITSDKNIDSALLLIDSYQPQQVSLSAAKHNDIVMKMLTAVANMQKKRLVSFTKNFKQDETTKRTFGGETYTNLKENEFVPANGFPETGFAINIDKASYSNIRRFINMGTIVPGDAVRIEEMLNYFNFEYEALNKDSVFTFQSKLTICPWNKSNQLLFLKVCSRKLDSAAIPPANLVFLVDVSGSMDMPNRLPLLKSAFKLMVNNLREKDTVSIVVYGSSVGVWMQPTCGKEKTKILESIESLYPSGATSGASGIHVAYTLAKSKLIPNGNNRVILATDGDFNVGQTSEDELEVLIGQNKQSGIYLTCLGVGMGNYKDSKLEILAKKGNGNFAYLDNEQEAEKVLVHELFQTLCTVADDAYLNIKFNPQQVKEYRLIGFDNKTNAIADSLSELEGGEVGSGHSLMALFEIKPTVNSSRNAHLANVSIDYKIPRDSSRRNITYTCPVELLPFKSLPHSYQFAAAVALYGSLLKRSSFTENATWSDVRLIATESADINNYLQKEFLQIVDKTKKIYSKGKKPRR